MGLLEIIIIILVVGWLFGFAFLGNGLIHIILVIAVFVLLLRLFRGPYERW